MTHVLALVIGFAAAVGMLVYVVVFFSLFVVMPFGAPYVPTSDANRKRVRNMLRGGKRVLELGSGDGRVMIDLAAANGSVDGYELNPILVWRSRRSLRKAGLSGRTRVFLRNFWNHGFGEYDAVCVYGIPYIMDRLGKKLRDELPAGAVVVSVGFPLPGWEPVRQDGTVRMYVHRG